MPKVSHSLRTRWMGGLQVEQEPEAVEVPFDIIVARVPFLKSQMGEELCLRRRFQPGRDSGDPDLRAFRVQIAAEPLEVGAEMQYEAAEGLVEERRVRRDQGENRGAVGVHRVQTERAVILPASEG